MIKSKIAILALALITIFCNTSCDDRININADYTTTPIIFGLLDQTDSVHMIKITKTFLGEGNNFDFAKVPDSSYFRDVEATITELKDGAETGRKWQLKDSTVFTKNDGIFYNPEQKVYVFYENSLLEDHEYRLDATMNEGEYAIDATTTLIDGFKYNQFFLSTPDLVFASNSGSPNNQFVSYTEGKNATGYQTKLIINYKEIYTDNSEAIKSITWSARANNGLTSADINPDNPKQNQSVIFRGEEFYSFIASQLNAQNNETNIDSRQIIDIDVVTEVGHEDLMKYIEISQPASGLAQTTPLFTNINGGLGLFSSRVIAKREGMGLSLGSTRVLCIEQPTNIYKFCSTLPLHSSDFFYCF